MDDKLCFVQFLHPGKEHKPDDGAHKVWNRRNHKRKFLRQGGKYIADDRVQNGDLLFWGEWEPESIVEREIRDPILRGPHFIYRPYYVVPKCYDGLQNTDPFVFGENFFYTWCQQWTKKGPTQLRQLSKGSVILFGSCEDNAFVVDVVFVVSNWIDHTRANYNSVLAGIPQEYKEVTILPVYQEHSTQSESCALEGSQDGRLYFGATYTEPVHGMYSFFPCCPYEKKSRGFARPRISLTDRITNNQNQGKNYGKKTGPPLNPGAIKQLWEKVAGQVREQGLAFGVYAKMPERRLTSGVPTF